MKRNRKISLIVSVVALHSSVLPWMQLKWLCNPVLSCHSCALAWFACPVGVLVHYSGWHVFPFLALGMLLLVGALVGRLLCGWVCPFGFLQDLLHNVPSAKFKLPAWSYNFKYLILILTVFAIPFIWGESTQYSFCRFCPAAAIQVTVPSLLSSVAPEASSAAAMSVDSPNNTLAGIEQSVAQTLAVQLSARVLVKLGILLAVVLFAMASARSFCKTLCPIGALLAPLNYASAWFIRTPRENCRSCIKCDRSCSMDIAPSERILAGVPANRHLDCIVCHECQTACPPAIPAREN
jgi:polyferredoxin